MKTVFYIRLNSEADLPTAFAAFYRQDTTTETDPETGEETTTPVGDPYLVLNTHDYAVDILGVIHEPTGVILTDAEGNEYPETAPVPGWHVNLRLLSDAMRAEAEALAATYGLTPSSPSRVWA